MDNKTSDSVENKKYRGVLRRKGGTFNATIGSRKKGSGSGVWLGTFHTAIEAAKAYDKAAFKMYGAKATLNFPTAIPMEESNNTNAVAPRAKRKHPSAALAVAPKPKRKQPSARASGSSISQHSQRVGLRNDKVKRDYFKWTDEYLVAFCTILKKHIDVNNENSQSKWDDLQLEFEKVVQHKFNTIKALRSKYENMTKRYKLWKLLKEGESGLRWNKTTQKLDFSDDWWESKIKENPEFIQILKRQPSKELQKAWHLLYEDVVSNGVNSVSSFEDANKSNETPSANPEVVVEDGVDSVAAPSVDPKKSNQLAFLNLESEDEDEDEDEEDEDTDGDGDEDEDEHEDEEEEEDEDTDGDGDADADEDVAVDENLDDHVQHTLHASQIGNMKTEEATSVSHFINEARQEDRSDGDGSKRSQKMAKTDIKTDQNATQQSVLTSVNKVGDSSISACISAINRMVDEGLMVSCSELWCFAVNLFEDDVKRELFISLPDDVGRLAWLQYKQNLDN